MYSRDDAKLRAENLRSIFKDLGHEITHSNALEVISRQYGYKDWNTCAATLDFRKKLLPPPNGWNHFAPAFENYDCGLDPSVKRHGAHPVTIRFKNNNVERKFYSYDMSQELDAAKYRGLRVKLACELKAEDVEGFVSIFLRTFNKAGKLMAWDDLHDRGDGRANDPISGTTEWREKFIVIDVPKTAHKMLIGFYLFGKGTAQLAGLRFNDVSADVPVTSSYFGLVPHPPKSSGWIL